MQNGIMETLQGLAKALEAGAMNAAPGTLVQGSALQVEDLSNVMHNVTFGEEHLKLQKMIKVESCKSTLFQFDRQLSYGIFGGSAQLEGAAGQEETSDFVRAVVPMCYYSHIRNVTVPSMLVATVDGVKSDDRSAADAAKKLAGDIEFDLFRGKADFSNAGVFDGNLLAVPGLLPNMQGLDLQVRSSDALSNTQDLMFAEYGSNLSVVIAGGGTLTQQMVEDAACRSALNFGTAKKLEVDPIVLSAYNKIALGKERIILAGSPQDSTGADLKSQWTSSGSVQVEASNFLRGKTGPARARGTSPGAPTLGSIAATNGTTSLSGTYYYYATACNELGESAPCAAQSISPTAGQYVTFTLAAGTGTVRYFNVYRSAAGGSAASAKFIGRAAYPGSTITFTDLGNKLPGFVTGFLVQEDTMGLKELAPYSRLKLAVTALNQPEAHFRFCSLAVYEPRKNVLIDNLVGSL